MASKNLGTLTVDLVARLGGFTQGMTKAERMTASAARKIAREKKEMAAKLEGIYTGIGNAATMMAGVITVAATAATAAFVSLASAGIDTADRLDELSARTGQSVETISSMQFVAARMGLTIDDVAVAYQKLTGAINEAQDPTSKMAALFKQAGIDMKDGTLTAQDALMQFATFVKSNNLSFEQTTDLASKIFGDKKGQAFVETLRLGGDGILALQEKARSLGVEISTNTAIQAAAFKDNVSDLKVQLQSTALNAIAPMLPLLTDMAIKFGENISKMQETGQVAGSLNQALAIMHTVVAAVIGAWGAFHMAIGAVMVLASQGVGVISSLTRAAVTGAKTLGAFGAAILSLMAGNMQGAKDYAAQAMQGLKDIVTMKPLKEGIADARLVFNEGTRLIQDGAKKMAGAVADAQKLVPVIGPPKVGAVTRPDNKPSSAYTVVDDDGGGKKRAKGSKEAKDALTEEEKAAAALAKRYAGMVEDLQKKIALVGNDSGLAALNYDLENGELSKLTESQKENLRSLQALLEAKEKQVEAEKKVQEEMKRSNEQFQEYLTNLEQNIALLGKTREEQEMMQLNWDIAKNMPYASDEQRAQLQGSLTTLQEMTRQTDMQVEAMDSVRQAAKGFFKDVVSGSKSFKDAFMDALDTIMNKLLDMIANNLIDSLFGQMGSMQTGSMGGGIGGIFGMMFGGGGGGGAGGGSITGVGEFFSGLFGGARANGGPVNGDQMYRFGERGPEILTMGGKNYMLPGERGQVTANRALGGSSQTNNFILEGRVDRRTQQQVATQVYRQTAAANARYS